MKTYWDLSEQERAGLDRGGVAAFADAELMLKGVLRPTPLTLVAVPEKPLATKTYYRVGEGYGALDIAFRSEADARAFLALRPMQVGSEWNHGSVVCAKPIDPDATIRTAELPSRDDVLAAKATIKERTAAEEENQRRTKAHEEQSEEAEKALKGLWEDWHACRERASKMQRIADTFAKYRELAGGDASVASKFLATAFGSDELSAYSEWTGTQIEVGAAES